MLGGGTPSSILGRRVGGTDGSLKKGDSWKAGHSHAIPGSQVPVYESLGTQILHATGNICHELHQHLGGQELGGVRARQDEVEISGVPEIHPSTLLALPCDAFPCL